MSWSTAIQGQNVGPSNPGAPPFDPPLTADCYLEIINSGHDRIYMTLSSEDAPTGASGMPIFPGTTSTKIYIIGTDNGGTGQIYLGTSCADDVPSTLLITTT